MKPPAFMRIKKGADESAILKKYAPKDLVVQEKIDGWKLFASKQAGGVRLYTRRGIDVTKSLPSIAERVDRLLPKGTAVLGEITYEIDGKQSITAAQAIVSAKPKKALEQTKALGGKLVYYVYDILERRGKKAAKEPLKKRDKWLRKLIPPRGIVQTLRNYRWSQRELAFKSALAGGGEGIVVKPWDSKYVYKKKGVTEPTGEWFKLKRGEKAQLAAVILDSYSKGKDKLIFIAHQIKDGVRIEVGKLSGLPKKIEKEVAKKIDAGKRLVAEVSFQERMPSGKLRHMGWKRLRPDKPISSVVANPKVKQMSNTREENPRRSKVKDALASESIRFSNFDDFAKAYWLDCASGFYWYATNQEHFHITSKEEGVSGAGRFSVACNPEFAIVGAANENKKYVAEIDVTALAPKDFKVIRGADGTKIKIVSNLDKAKVTRVLEVDRALRSWKYQQSLLPSSKDQLRIFWKGAHKAEKERVAKEAAHKEKVRKREERRKEREHKAKEKKAKKGRKNPNGLWQKAERDAHMWGDIYPALKRSLLVDKDYGDLATKNDAKKAVRFFLMEQWSVVASTEEFNYMIDEMTSRIMEDKKGRRNPTTSGLEFPPQYGGPVTVRTDSAEYSYAGRDGDYDMYQVGKDTIGVIDGAIQQPEYEWSGRADRFYAYNYATYREAEGSTLENVLDKAHRGLLNPKKRTKNPAYLITAMMNPYEESVAPGVREVPSHVNSPKY